MKIGRKAVIAVIVLAAGVWLYFGRYWNDDDPRTITVKIVDQYGRPISHARASIYIRWSGNFTFRTNDRGLFVSNRWAGQKLTADYIMSARVFDQQKRPVAGASVSLPMTWGWWQPAVSDAHGQFNIHLPSVSHRGIVTLLGKSGKPLPHATVIWMDGKETELRYTTDKNGHARQSEYENRLMPMHLDLVAVAQGCAYATADLNPKKRWAQVVRLSPERLVTARVVDENGRPLSGVTIKPEAIDGKDYVFTVEDDLGHEGISAASNSNGRFELHHLPGASKLRSATVYIGLQAPGRAKIFRRYKLGALENSQIVLPRECIVRGFLKIPAGAQLTKGLSMDIGLSDGGGTTKVGPDGRFSFSGLPPGSATMELWAGMESKPLTFVVPPFHLETLAGRTINVVVPAARGALIEGIIKDEHTGKPIPKFPMMIRYGGRFSDDFVKTDSHGQFSCRVFAGGLRFDESNSMVEDKYPLLHPTTLRVKNGERKSVVIMGSLSKDL